MQELAHLVMDINPSIEVYLLDRQGKILSHALPKDSVLRQRVNLAPLKVMLEGQRQGPIQGDDPRNPDGHRIFSVFPVSADGKVIGYLYVVLGGQVYQTLADSLRGSYILQSSLAGVLLIMLFGFTAAAIIFAVLTRPLRRLAAEVDQFQRQELNWQPALSVKVEDELQQLELAFGAMQIRIREQLARLKETDRVRRELISNVSHDLRTPLASMQGYLETLMLKDAELNVVSRHQYLGIAFSHCQRLTKLVTELFELSKLDAGRMQPERENFSLAELLQDVLHKFELEAREKDIELRLHASDGLCNVCADIALIERVLENLINNALRYTPEGGRVDLTLAQQDRQVEVAVSDTGVGIRADDLPYIFERYYQGKISEPQSSTPVMKDELPQNTYPGTGLGLAIVKRILELHGSRIEVTSQPLRGTCFRFPLPLRSEDARATPVVTN